ncbi:MAG: hypothetical protein DRQ62_06615 [Gammaproteobacteria bacterium]|nr:MAG: hypothetical protein DRQ62_06615 [Gammaproteobacteria bacterium]
MMVRPKDIKDNAMPSANALAVTVLALLSRRTANLEYADKATTALAAFTADINKQPTSYTRLLSAAAILNNGQTGSVQYAAKGAVTIRAKRTVNNQVLVSILLKPGWHINASKPLQDALIATKISLARGKLSHVIYPPVILKKLSFGQQKLALYENQLTVQATLPEALKDKPMIKVQVQLQACNDKHCLAPETLMLEVFKFVS